MIQLEWLVIKVTPNAKLNGEIVDLRCPKRGQPMYCVQTVQPRSRCLL